MQYKVITVTAVSGFSADSGLLTNIPNAALELSKLVNQDILAGWAPIGGVATGFTQHLNEPFLLQAMVHK